MDTLFYIKDTGYKNTNLTGDVEWKVNQGNPIELHLTSYNLDSKANFSTYAYTKDSYYSPDLVSTNFTVLTLSGYAVKSILNNTFYLYNSELQTYDSCTNPSIQIIAAFFEQMKNKESHLDLYMSDGSGVTPDYFKNTPFYWLSLINKNTSDTVTPEQHINVRLTNYHIRSNGLSRVDFTLTLLVLP